MLCCNAVVAAVEYIVVAGVAGVVIVVVIVDYGDWLGMTLKKSQRSVSFQSHRSVNASQSGIYAQPKVSKVSSFRNPSPGKTFISLTKS